MYLEFNLVHNFMLVRYAVLALIYVDIKDSSYYVWSLNVQHLGICWIVVPMTKWFIWVKLYSMNNFISFVFLSLLEFIILYWVVTEPIYHTTWSQLPEVCHPHCYLRVDFRCCNMRRGARLDFKDGGKLFLGNVGSHSLNSMTSHPRKP